MSQSAPRSHDAFVSYASQDVVVANEIVAALERHRLSCWIAPRDVTPGALYADEIISAINDAKVVVLVLSQHAVSSPHVGKEIERASAKRRPIVTLRVDATPLTRALEYFLSESQWIDLGPEGVAAQAPKLVDAVRRLSQGGVPPVAGAVSAAAPVARSARRLGWPLVAAGVAVVALGAYIMIEKAGVRPALTRSSSDEGAAAPTAAGGTQIGPGGAATQPSTGTAFAPPPHSIAVLPFVNMSGDPKQDYFSDGLSEELLSSLSAVRDLRVAAQTSSFSFKGKNVELGEIARKLNVGAILEGSVRKDGQHVRVTAQLVNAMSGFDLWAHTYDRELTDVLKLQADIATAVTGALQATLLADAAATIELGGTENPAAFDAYLHAKKLFRSRFDKPSLIATIAALKQATELDPHFAKAFATKARAENFYAEYYGVGPEIREHFASARAAAVRAVELTPDLGDAHSALASVLEAGFLDLRGALAEHERALTLAPNDAGVLRNAGLFLTDSGRAEEGIALVRHGVAIDQLNAGAYQELARALISAHRYRDAVAVANQAASLDVTGIKVSSISGHAQLLLGEFESARASCDVAPLGWEDRMCLAIADDKLHRHADAEAQVAALRAEYGEATSYQFADIYAQWGDVAKALGFLEDAYRVRDPGLTQLRTDAFLDPLRGEPRFQALERKLDFPP